MAGKFMLAAPVGQACGSNPIPIIIPCHRVLAAHGPGGYSGFGGLETKITLLKHERAWPYLL
ncbi:MAG: methylated-DNA--[protein]-cysteine S-methyltransferase [Gammaproteobacteria bacterium]|nr:methylated-DNA--[protein]-cysteine S-methyltransferase [Gammaproteobacteria bacterium]